MLTENLTENRIQNTEERLSFHPATRTVARIISYIFHPLFIPLYIGWFLIYPGRYFPGGDAWEHHKLMISFFVNYTFLPLVTLLIAKGLGFVQSIFLKTQKDRIIPFVVCQIFYFWVWYVFRNQSMPRELVMFALAVFIASAFGLMLNAYIKVSMHALSIGVVIPYFILLGMMTQWNYGPYISIVTLVAGLVCTSRLITNDHNPREVYIGLFAGALAQLAAYLFS